MKWVDINWECGRTYGKKIYVYAVTRKVHFSDKP
jgi:hypothetical protein